MAQDKGDLDDALLLRAVDVLADQVRNDCKGTCRRSHVFQVQTSKRDNQRKS